MSHPPPDRCHLLASLTISVVMLTACGGGSPAPEPAGGPPPAPTPVPPPPVSSPPPPPAPTGVAMLGSCPAFPATAVFNTRIDDVARFPAHAQSTAWINNIGATRSLHADWGRSEDPSSGEYYGIPVNLLSATSPETDWPAITFATDSAPDESDCAVANTSGGHDIVRNCTTPPAASLRFPYPRDNVVKIEGADCAPGTCDRHVLIVEQGACRLWESYSVTSVKVGGQWSAYSTAAWDLNSNAMRADTWTSGDAAGLPIAPLLARAAEASTGEIPHALRVTFRDSVLARAHVWPARHSAGGATTNGIPFGALLRLKADVVIPSTWTTQAKAIATAMQRHGLYVSDIGSDLYVQGDPSTAWSAATITQIQSLRMNQFEFVDTSAITGHASFSANSYRASW